MTIHRRGSACADAAVPGRCVDAVRARTAHARPTWKRLFILGGAPFSAGGMTRTGGRRYMYTLPCVNTNMSGKASPAAGAAGHRQPVGLHPAYAHEQRPGPQQRDDEIRGRAGMIHDFEECLLVRREDEFQRPAVEGVVDAEPVRSGREIAEI